jgi:pimeloyl-ACP methyl ester carboxylesterase
LDSRASSLEIERVRSAIVASIELLSVEAIAVVLLTPVRFGQLLLRLGPVLWRLRRLAIACDSALIGYVDTETSLVSNLNDFRTAVPVLANRLPDLAAGSTLAWASPRATNIVATPPTLLQLAARLRLLSNSGQPVVRIEQYRFGEHNRFIVYIPGTQNLSLKSTSNPFDMRSNLLLLAGGRSAASRATELAMRRVGVGAQDEVMLVGHSQGGLIALDLARRSASGLVPYRVEHVVTFGTPAGLNTASTLPNVVSFENRADLVPKLEFRKNQPEKNWLTLEGNVLDYPIDAHRMESYEQILVEKLASGESKEKLEELGGFASGEARLSYFELGQR